MDWSMILLEGIALCFILLMICVIGIANGPVGCVYFYEPAVQEKVVKLGLTTKEKNRKIPQGGTDRYLCPGFDSGARNGIFCEWRKGILGCVYTDHSDPMDRRLV